GTLSCGLCQAATQLAQSKAWRLSFILRSVGLDPRAAVQRNAAAASGRARQRVEGCYPDRARRDETGTRARGRSIRYVRSHGPFAAETLAGSIPAIERCFAS